MPALLFEEQEELKFYTPNLTNNTLRVVVQNHEVDAKNIFCEFNLSIEDLNLLQEWISEQRRIMEKNKS